MSCHFISLPWIGAVYVREEVGVLDLETCAVPSIIDVEASGFGAGSYPIELAFASPNGVVEGCFIKPVATWIHWSEEAAQLHGIDREYLMAEGLEVMQVVHWLNDRLHDQLLYSDAWHYDFSWIHCLCSEVGIWPSFRIGSLSELLTEQERSIWPERKAKVTASLGLRTHRASCDVRILQATFVDVKSLSQASG